jgi:dCMP deaminase
MSKALLLHIPVLHNGYIKIFEKYTKEIRIMYIFDKNLASEISDFNEIRAVDPNKTLKMIKSLGFPFQIKLLSKKNLKEISNTDLIISNDFISKKFLKKYSLKNKFEIIDTFLRWDEGNVQSPNPPHYDSESSLPFDIKMMSKAKEVGGVSTDWWRRVGCVVVKNKKVLVTSFNEHFPKNDTQYAEGDPRDFIKSGKLGFLASSAHAEQMAIAKAANKGISLKGADMYVSTYPCPTCAKFASVAGIKKCYFQGGNSYLDVAAVFKSSGLKAILVKENN